MQRKTNGLLWASLGFGCMSFLAVAGCDVKEEVIDVDTPRGGVEVDRSPRTGEVDVEVERDGVKRDIDLDLNRDVDVDVSKDGVDVDVDKDNK